MKSLNRDLQRTVTLVEHVSADHREVLRGAKFEDSFFTVAEEFSFLVLAN